MHQVKLFRYTGSCQHGIAKSGADGRAMGSRSLISGSHGATVHKLRLIKFQIQSHNLGQWLGRRNSMTPPSAIPGRWRAMFSKLSVS